MWFLFLTNAPLRPFDVQASKVSLNANHAVILSAGNFPPDGYQWLIKAAKWLQDSQFPALGKGSVSPNAVDAIAQLGTACENMRAAAWYLQSIREILEEYPESREGNFTRLYSEVVETFLMNFGQFTFRFFAPGFIQLGDFEQGLKQIKWNIQAPPDLVSEPPPYVKAWRIAATAFRDGLPRIALDHGRKDELWAAVWQYTCYLLLAAFSGTSKATDAGRALMKFIVTALSEVFQGLKPASVVVDSTWVLGFVDAFYLKLDAFHTWAQTNSRKYTLQQFMSLVESGLHEDLGRQPKKTLKYQLEGMFKDQTA
jgi:hypothetical protein